MIFNSIQGEPVLITLEGDGDPLQNILSPDDYDYLLGGEEFSDSDIEYYADNYPELMGVAVSVIAKVGSGVSKIVRRIVARIRARRARRRGQSVSTPQPVPQGPVYGPQPTRGSGLVYNPASGYRGAYPAPYKTAGVSDNSMGMFIVAGAVLFLGSELMKKPKRKTKRKKG